MTKVILVDEQNNELAVMDKLEAHQKGLLHRAFSIFVFTEQGELIIQQRNKSKYHCGGLWSNTVCSHPKPEEDYQTAIHRRLIEEMGFDCPLKQCLCFIYKAKFDNGLTEYEYDCVFEGVYDGEVHPNPEEVSDYKTVTIPELIADMKQRPSEYTYWFKKIILEKNIFQPNK